MRCAWRPRAALRWAPMRRLRRWHRSCTRRWSSTSGQRCCTRCRGGRCRELMLAQWDDVLADLAAATTILRTGGLDQPPAFSCRIWTVAAFIQTARGRDDEADRLLAMLPTTLGEDRLISSSPAVALAQVRRGQVGAARHRLTVIDDQIRGGDVLSCLARIDLADVDGDWDGARQSIDGMLDTPDPEGPPAPYGGVCRRARAVARRSSAATAWRPRWNSPKPGRRGRGWALSGRSPASNSRSRWRFVTTIRRQPRITPDVRSRCSSRSVPSTRSSAAAPSCRTEPSAAA